MNTDVTNTNTTNNTNNTHNTDTTNAGTPQVDMIHVDAPDVTAPQILIFKTNIRTIVDKLTVKRVLDAHRQIEKWTIDLEDIDRVLRIVCRTLSCPDIIQLVAREGYQCAELE